MIFIHYFFSSRFFSLKLHDKIEINSEFSFFLLQFYNERRITDKAINTARKNDGSSLRGILYRLNWKLVKWGIYHRYLSPCSINDFEVLLIWLYADFFDDTIHVNQKFIMFFSNSWPTNITHLLSVTSIIVHHSIITGNDKKYIVPTNPIFIRKFWMGSLFLFPLKVIKAPTMKMKRLMIRKARRR